MRHSRPTLRSTRAAAATAAIILLAVAPGALADTPAADTDSIAIGTQAMRDLGEVAPGAAVNVPFDLVLTCSGTSHVDAGTTVAYAFGGGSTPGDGSADFAGATTAPITSFPADGDGCARLAQSVTTPTSVDLLAPTTPGGPYTYTLMFVATPSNGDDAAISRPAFLTLTLTVVSNTRPTLHLPADMTVEGNESNGATVTWTATASDTEDASAPTTTCSPASGSHFKLGSTTVDCSATDTGGLTTSGSFDVTVADTTPPALSAVPTSIETTTTNQGGRVVSFAPPGASDVVDPNPTVSCVPQSGSTFAVGTTPVTCTATDASGNHSSASFGVTVRLAQATFDAPIGPSNSVDANGSRSIPVKARLSLDGSDVTSGAVSLVVGACEGGASVRSVDLVWSSGRWTGKLDTSGLAGGCWRASVVVGSAVLGGFDVQVPAPTPSKAPIASRGKSKP